MSLYCDTPVPAFQLDVCANEKSRVTAVAFLRTDHTITNFESAGDWNTAIANGKAIVIKNTRGDKPKSTANSIDGFGKEMNRTVGRDFALNYKHPDVIDNIDFYNALNYNSSYMICYYTSGGKLFVETVAIANVDADYIIPEGLNDIITWDVVVNWSGQDMASSFNGPASVFE